MTSLSTITLPDDIIWLDEHKWSGVRQSVSRTAGGRLIVQSGGLSKGRPLTMRCHWLDKATVDSLIAIKETPGAIAVLTLPDARTFNVMFRVHESESVVATPVIDYAIYSASDLFDVTIKLMEV